MLNEEAEFWSKIAQKYDRVVDLQVGTETRSIVRERLAEEARLGHLAEFGCGTGFFTGVLAGKADTLVATDISPGMLETAKHQINAPNVTFQVEDCQSTSLPTATFDAAFIGFVLQFTEPDRTLAEMHRILKPGGMLIIANPDPKALSGLDYLRGVFRILQPGTNRVSSCTAEATHVRDGQMAARSECPDRERPLQAVGTIPIPGREH